MKGVLFVSEPGPDPGLGMSGVFHLMKRSYRAPENLLPQLLHACRAPIVHVPAWAHNWSLALRVSPTSAFFSLARLSLFSPSTPNYLSLYS